MVKISLKDNRVRFQEICIGNAVDFLTVVYIHRHLWFSTHWWEITFSSHRNRSKKSSNAGFCVKFI